MRESTDLFYEDIGPPFRWDEERRFLLRCELDAAFFQSLRPVPRRGGLHPGHLPHRPPQIRHDYEKRNGHSIM